MKKIIAVLLLSAMIGSMMCACQMGVENSNDSEPVPPAESTARKETTKTVPPEESETVAPSQDIPQPPVEIETTGGAVIVGKIGFDEKGWHIVPEQPLNITYTYFLEKPSVFPAQTRVSMMDPRDDGVEKSVYLGQTVTVSGELRFVRNDFETVYLLPYTITMGKVAAGSYGDSALKRPEEPIDRYDRSLPLPKEMAPRITDGRYTYNPFMLSDESLQLMGNDFAPFYCGFVDAVLHHRSEIPCPEQAYAEMLSTVIYYDFPIFNACAEPFSFYAHYDRETEMLNIAYKYSEDEHRALLDRFFVAADAMLAAVTSEMSDAEKAKKLYHALCTRMVYDDSALEDFERKDSRFAYLNNSGVCITFANVYNQLLTQVGIKTTLASCDYSPTMSHIWSVVTLDGRDYFCDPTFELSRDHGNGYMYFGMSYADRTRDGIGQDGIRAGKYYPYTVLPDMIAEKSWEK